ncbi:MAG TPA: hypothetical protein VK577_24095 [Bradyrhizobium sp.]|nr:hypothetical protein [Bradyrhizobium sp.]
MDIAAGSCPEGKGAARCRCILEFPRRGLMICPTGGGSGALRGEAVNVRLDVVASEAKQSIFLRKGRMDCFVASLLAMTVCN